MFKIALLCAGSAYLINGLNLLGRLEAKNGAALNILIGLLLTLTAGQILLAGPGSAGVIELAIVASALGFTLFGITFLFVGISGYAGHGGSAVGWFCGWACLIAGGLAATHYLVLGDPRSAQLWGVWTIVYLAFFLVSGLGISRLARAAGWLSIAAGFTTCVIPGGLLILGLWETIPVWALGTAQLVTLGLFLALAIERPVAKPLG